MKAIIDKMRADFVLVGEDRIQSGQWTEQDYAEVGGAIKAAIATNEPTQIMTWARWLADLAAWVTAYRLVCAPINRCIELRIEEQRAAERFKSAIGGQTSQAGPSSQPSGSSRGPKHTGT
jgi:hypothetical protein